MPHVFPSGQFPPGACGQVRPVGATLPTAARQAPREAADGDTCPQARAASPQVNTSFKDRGPAPGKRHRHTRMAIWRGQLMCSRADL